MHFHNGSRPNALRKLGQCRGVLSLYFLPTSPVFGADIDEVRIVGEKCSEGLHVVPIPSLLPTFSKGANHRFILSTLRLDWARKTGHYEN